MLLYYVHELCYYEAMKRYGIATLFETYPDGYEFTEANAPLHLTHVDVVEVDLQPEEFINKLMQHLREQQRFDVIPVGDTFYGPNKDIPVTVIELSAELKSFHEHLIQFLESNGASFDNPQFLKEHYGPHISIYGSRRVSLSEPVTIHSISIGHKRTDIENPPNRIIATIPLL